MKFRYTISLILICFGAPAVLAQEVAPAKASVHWVYVSNPVFFDKALPRDNPQSDAKVKLGEDLFNETRMSANGKVSCATCHNPAFAFTDRKVVSQGVGNTVRNSPTIVNAMFNPEQFWDGRAPSLEEQAKLPIVNPVEMGLKNGEEAESKIRAIPEYGPRFKSVFGSSEITYNKIAMAIAAFERTKVSTPAPFDRFLAGDEKAISDPAKRGWSLFNGQGRCLSCHQINPTGAFFTDYKFHNIGVAARKINFPDLAREGLTVVNTGNKEQIDKLAIESDKFTELGRFLVTKNPGDVGAFKTPTLRNIMVTAPYMHDGSMRTLWDVIDHYNKGGVANPYLDGGMHRLDLTEGQIDDLVAFLATLTSPEFKAQGESEFNTQKKLSRSQRPERDTALAQGKKGDASDADLVQKGRDPSTLGGRPLESSN